MSYTPPNPNGQATSANSAPVVIASDQSAIPVTGTITASGDHTVVGKAASGAAAAGNPVLIAGSDGTNARTILTDTTGRQHARLTGAGSSTSGTFTASGQTVTLAVNGEMTVSISFYGTYSSLAWAPEYSPDGGTSWGPITMSFMGSLSAGPTLTNTHSSTASASSGIMLHIPTVATHVRVRSTGLSSGTANVIMAADPGPRPEAPALRPSFLQASNGTSLNTATAGDALANPSTALGVVSYATLYAGAGPNTWARSRYPTTFKTVAATASGDTALWTPAAGRKFNIMGGHLQIPAGATAATQEIDVTLRDGTTPTAIVVSISLPSAVTTPQGGGYVIPFDVGPVGLISATANNVLNVNLSAALTASKVRAFVYGTEE